MNPTLENGVSFEYALLETYKKLHLDEKDVMVILMVDHLLKKGNAFIVPSTLAMVMNYDEMEIDQVLSRLMLKKYFVYGFNGSNQCSIEPLKAVVYRTLMEEILKDEDRDIQKRVSHFSHLFEDYLKRPLAPLERETIRNWLEDGFSDEEIDLAIKNVPHRSNLRGIELELKQNREREKKE